MIPQYILMPPSITQCTYFLNSQFFKSQTFIPVLTNLPHGRLALNDEKNNFVSQDGKISIVKPKPIPGINLSLASVSEKLKTEELICLKKEEYHQLDFHHTENSLIPQIENIVAFFVEKFGQVSDIEVEQERRKHITNKDLASLFDILLTKYMSTAKSRDEMVRFTLRKALTSSRDSLRLKYKMNAKEASFELCKKYFQFKSEGIPKQEDDEQNRQKVLDFLLPYKKNSKNKTPNMCFISEILSSEDFRQDYMQYLLKFDEIVLLENQKKTAKFRDFLVECLQKNVIHKAK